MLCIAHTQDCIADMQMLLNRGKKGKSKVWMEDECKLLVKDVQKTPLK